MALTLMKKGYRRVWVVSGGWKAMRKAGFPMVWEGKIHLGR